MNNYSRLTDLVRVAFVKELDGISAQTRRRGGAARADILTAFDIAVAKAAFQFLSEVLEVPHG